MRIGRLGITWTRPSDPGGGWRLIIQWFSKLVVTAIKRDKIRMATPPPSKNVRYERPNDWLG